MSEIMITSSPFKTAKAAGVLWKEAALFSGEVGKISQDEEIKMELYCPAELAKKAVQVIKNIHPYEEPVINLIPLIDPSDLAEL